MRTVKKAKSGYVVSAESRWRGQETQFVGIRGRRYKLWWSGNNNEIGCVGILFTEELCEKVVEVRRKNDTVMAMVLVFEEKVIRAICAYAPQDRRLECEKDQFSRIMIWQVSGICKTLVKWMVWRLQRTWADGLMVLRVCMVHIELAKEMLREEDYSSFVI